MICYLYRQQRHGMAVCYFILGHYHTLPFARRIPFSGNISSRSKKREGRR